MTIKIDAFGAETQLKDNASAPVAAGSSPGPTPTAAAAAAGSSSGAAVAAGDTAPAAASGFDSDKFEDEDKFLVLLLDGGKLAAAQDDLGAKQRLYNLGFGARRAENMQKDEQDRAVRAFRKTRGLSDSTDLQATKNALETEHEKTDVPPPDPDAPGPVA